jgi:hypothetical protein
MGLTLEQARELRERALQDKKKQRKVRVDELVSKSLCFAEVEAGLREKIINNPEQKVFGITVLDVVTNDWNDPARDIIRLEVYEALVKKYGELFYGCDISEVPRGNNAMAFHLTMRL